MDIKFDPNSLTLGEMEKVEEITGRPISLVLASMGAGELSAKAITAFVFVTQRRTNPEFTLDDARAASFSDLTFVNEAPKG